MKRFNKVLFAVICCLCVAAMTFSLVACGGAGEEKPATSAEKTTQATVETQAPQSKQFTVTFDSQGGSAVAAATVNEGATVEKPADPTKDGFIFGGWATDAAGSTAYDFASKVTADVTLYAVWNDASNTSTVTFDLNYEGSENISKSYANNSRISKPADPTREGYSFGGWYTDTTYAEAFSDMKKYEGDKTFYAKWLKIYTLEAENTQLTNLDPGEDPMGVTLSGTKKGNGRSGEANGVDMIGKNSSASGGMYVHGLYYPDAYLEFDIQSDAAAENVQVVVRLSAEFKDYALTSSDFAVEINGKKLKYNSTINLTQDMPFADFVISTSASLKEGENVIKLIVLNSEKQFGDGTVNAAAPMIDCIKIYSTSNITMTRYNTEITDK